jgi:hypothetical protein
MFSLAASTLNEDIHFDIVTIEPERKTLVRCQQSRLRNPFVSAPAINRRVHGVPCSQRIPPCCRLREEHHLFAISRGSGKNHGRQGSASKEFPISLWRACRRAVDHHGRDCLESRPIASLVETEILPRVALVALLEEVRSFSHFVQIEFTLRRKGREFEIWIA